MTNTPNTRLDEPLLTPNIKRFIQFPIEYHEIYKAYKIHEASFWTAADIDYQEDLTDWESLTENQRFFIEHVLAFFACADGIVQENLIQNFSCEVQIPEARNFYAFQAMIENVHAEVYGLLLDTLVTDPKRKELLFNAVTTIPCIKDKADWCMEWMDQSKPFEQRVFAFAIVEGLFFSGSFCAIFYFKHLGLMVRALGTSNEFISRDENYHTQFALLILRHLNNKIDMEVAKSIIMGAVEIERRFICDSLPCELIGMNSNLMYIYIKYVADQLMQMAGFPKIYNEAMPFDWMKNIGIDGKTNFFEKRVTEYRTSSSCEMFDKEVWDDIDL